MKYIIIGKNIEVTPGLKTAVEDKIGKLEKYFTPKTEVHVTLSVEKDRQKIEVTIPVKGNIIRSEQVSNDMYVSIDLVEEIIERQLKKYKNKLVDKQQAGSFFKQEFIEKDYMDEEEISMHEKVGFIEQGYNEEILDLKEELKHLSSPEKRLIKERYENGHTQNETSKILGISQVQVSRKEKEILTRLRARLQ